MKNNILKTNFELIGLQIIFSIISIFLFYVFSWANIKVFSFFTAWIYLGAIHSTFWQLGRKDAKYIKIINNHLDEGKPHLKQNAFKGALYGLPFLLLNIIYIILALYAKSDVMFIIHRFLMYSFIGFLPEKVKSFYLLYCLIICIVMYIPCFSAYIWGMKNMSLIEKYFPKILYKNPNKNNNKDNKK